MTIFLTGSTGFIGRHLLRRLTAEGHRVLCSQRGDNIYSSLMASNTDVIIHCAGEVKDSSKMFESNVILTHELLTCAYNTTPSGAIGWFKPPKVIIFGSSSEYGPTNEVRHENMLCHPSDMYETTKLAATVLCQGYAAMGLDACVVRPFSVYGPGLQSNRFIPVLYRSFFNENPIELHFGTHDWIYIDDFVEGVMLLLSQPDFVTQEEIFNLGTGISTSNEEIVRLFEKLLDKKANVRYSDNRLHLYDVENWQADISKMNALGWEPKVKLEEGLKRFIDEN
jgi:nucleoside-diphosphate-sugar epimerase